jgi:hypothetical protein
MLGYKLEDIIPRIPSCHFFIQETNPLKNQQLTE